MEQSYYIERIEGFSTLLRKTSDYDNFFHYSWLILKHCESLKKFDEDLSDTQYSKVAYDFRTLLNECTERVVKGAMRVNNPKTQMGRLTKARNFLKNQKIEHDFWVKPIFYSIQYIDIKILNIRNMPEQKS